MTKLSDVLLSR